MRMPLFLLLQLCWLLIWMYRRCSCEGVPCWLLEALPPVLSIQQSRYPKIRHRNAADVWWISPNGLFATMKDWGVMSSLETRNWAFPFFRISLDVPIFKATQSPESLLCPGVLRSEFASQEHHAHRKLTDALSFAIWTIDRQSKKELCVIALN